MLEPTVLQRVKSLSNRQRQCLVLVGRLMSTKDIATELRIQPGTVDSYIKEAIALLGARDRRDAARIVQQAELEPAPCQSGGQKVGLDGPLDAWPSGDTRIDQASGSVGSTPLADSESSRSAQLNWYGLSWTVSRPVDLSRRQRLGMVLKIVVALALSYGGAVVFVAGVQEVLGPYL